MYVIKDADALNPVDADHTGGLVTANCGAEREANWG